MRAAGIAILLAACGGSASAPTGPVLGNQPEPSDVTVELAAVTLAEDCGGPVARAPAAEAVAASAVLAAPAKSAPAMPAPGAMAPCAAGQDCGSYRQACTQTSMQLALHASDAATLTVTHVELLDASGASLGELTASAPTSWDDAEGTYVPWNERLAAGTTLQASYQLTAPDWSQVEGGRWGAQDDTFQLRVTVTVDGTTRVVEKQALAPAHLEPPVPT